MSIRKYATVLFVLTCLCIPMSLLAQDDREDFEATFYTGASIDSFAAQDLQKYLNPSASGTKQLGYVAGADFAYRLIGIRESNLPQLWVYGETLHGQRSAEVDCSQKTENGALPEQCDLDGFKPKPGAFIGILRNSSSLEAYSGLRFEFLTLHAGGDHPTKLYLKSELGFFTVAGSGGDVFDSHQKLALGLLDTKGAFRDSYLETGWGKSDVFSDRRGRRFKVDGYLTWDLGGKCSWMRKLGMKPFLQITLDSDLGPGADSVRTFYGFNFDLKHLVVPDKPKTTDTNSSDTDSSAKDGCK
jgi:hypothetical protein